MSKIKLLILLSISLFFLGCSTKTISSSKSLQVGYIGGGADGLIFKNLLIANINASGIYNKNSNYMVEASINHTTNFYITNTDNTSDREKISTALDLKVLNSQANCIAYSFKEEVSQFYIVADSSVFTSNDAALEDIKINNTESLIKMFLFDFDQKDLEC